MTGNVVTSKVELHNSVATWTCLPIFTKRECLERPDATSFTGVSRFLTSRTGMYKTVRTFDRGNG